MVFALVSQTSVEGCTGIVRTADNGDVVFARTLEFADSVFKFELSVIPRGIEYIGQTPDGQPGMKWKMKYATVGFTPFGLPLIADGMNEKGLAVGAFYFPGYAEYQKFTQTKASKTLSQVDLPTWILGNFTKVSEVIAAIKDVNVVQVSPPALGLPPPLHYIVVDEEGNRLVIEYTNGTVKLHDAPLNVITNSPTYDWHTTNARNYIGLDALNRPAVNVDGKELSQLGQGSGAIGLPGDFTPPSRFIRAGFLNAAVYQGKNGSEEVGTAFKILNQFDIPKGSVREKHDGKVIPEVTQWTSASDLKGKKYYFHTQQNRAIRSLDFAHLDLNGTKVISIVVDQPEEIQDVSSKFKEQ
jgi:choloylglycine hydrolase